VARDECQHNRPNPDDSYANQQPPLLDTIERTQIADEAGYQDTEWWTSPEAYDAAIASGKIVGVSVPKTAVKDYTGTIDGTGVKGSMTDASKPPLSLIDPTFILGLGAVLGFGARKYAAGNWLKGMKWSEVLNGIKRHLAAIETGEMIDSDSGLPHVYHASCGIMFLARFTTDPAYKQFDDRLFAKAAP